VSVFGELILGKFLETQWLLLGMGLKTFLTFTFVILATFSHAFPHSLTLCHALVPIVTPWLLFVHHLMLGLNALASPNVTTPQTTRKHVWPSQMDRH